MARRPRRRLIGDLVAAIQAQLRIVGDIGEGFELRAAVLQLVAIQHNFADLGVSIAARAGITAEGARDRIRQYMVLYVGVPIEGAELQVVSGIPEFARRIRELRVEDGYQIVSGASSDIHSGLQLKQSQYILLHTEPDRDAAHRWRVANRIRRGGGGAQAKILDYLRHNVGRVITTEELRYVSGGSAEFARRLRELRTEEGFAIATRFTGRPDLAMSQYVLESVDRVAEVHDRQIPDEVQREVYQRDRNTCRSCGWNRDRWAESDPRLLELHHLEEHVVGGANTADNLVVLCSRCHDGVHAGRIEIVRESSGLVFHARHSRK